MVTQQAADNWEIGLNPATLGGTSGLGGIYDSVDGVDGRSLAQGCLTTAAACASGAKYISSAAGPGGAIAAGIFGVVGDALGGGLDAYDAQKCRAGLRQIWTTAHRKSSSSPEWAKLEEALSWALGKQRMKMRKGMGKASIIGQPFTHLYRGGKAIFKAAKGTKGANRDKYSKVIYEVAKTGGEAGAAAQKAICFIVGKKFDEIIQASIKDAMKSG